MAVGLSAGITLAVLLILIAPPEHPADRVFYLLVGGGFLGLFGLLCGYLWSLIGIRRATVFDGIAVLALVCSISTGFFFAKSAEQGLASLFQIVGILSVMYLVMRAALGSWNDG